MSNKEYKVGDRVVRINGSNGPHAKVGEVATVVAVMEISVFVVYPGFHLDSTEYMGEEWAKCHTAHFSPQTITTEQALAVLRAEGEVTFKPHFKPITVRLNSSYTAIVTREGVKVGCQKFSLGVVKDLYDAVLKAEKHG